MTVTQPRGRLTCRYGRSGKRGVVLRAAARGARHRGNLNADGEDLGGAKVINRRQC